MIRKKLNSPQIIKLAVFCCAVVLSYSCQSKTEKRLIGLWAFELDSCVVQNRNWLTETCSNAMTIEQNQVCQLPVLCNQNRQKATGTWQLIAGTADSILFNVPENPLRGQYIITFYKDYNSMKFKMKLQNDSTLLICSKSVISFMSNPQDLLDEQ